MTMEGATTTEELTTREAEETYPHPPWSHRPKPKAGIYDCLRLGAGSRVVRKDFQWMPHRSSGLACLFFDPFPSTQEFECVNFRVDTTARCGCTSIGV